MIMADSNTCKCKETNEQTNWMHEQLLLLAQLVKENKDIIKEKLGVGITPKTKGDTFLKGHYHKKFLKCLRSQAILRIVCGLCWKLCSSKV